MSDSFSILPLDSQVREWLTSEGYTSLPQADGRQPTLAELKEAIESISNTSSQWVGNYCALKTSAGLHTTLLVSELENSSGFCEFHFKGGHEALVEQVSLALSGVVGPLVIHAHSGCFTRVVHAV